MAAPFPTPETPPAAVHFVYRCHNGNPSEKWVRHFDADTVLDQL